MFSKIVRKIQRFLWLHTYAKMPFFSKGTDVVLDNRISFVGTKYISLGNNIYIGSDSAIQCFDQYKEYSYSPSLVIGNNVSFSRRITIYCAGGISIGNNCLFGSDILVTDENHGLLPVGEYRDNPLHVEPITIGSNVWVGDKAIILPGVEIGDNSIIGSGSVVTKSIPSNVIVRGNPARIIKRYNKELEKWETNEE